MLSVSKAKTLLKDIEGCLCISVTTINYFDTDLNEFDTLTCRGKIMWTKAMFLYCIISKHQIIREFESESSLGFTKPNAKIHVILIIYIIFITQIIR